MFLRLHNMNRNLYPLRLVLLLFLLALLVPSQAQAYDPHFRFPWPASVTHRISGGNGYNCNTHVGGDYYAIDFEFSTGQDVNAAQGGSVLTVGNDPAGYGVYVDVDHGNGFVSRYAHLQTSSAIVSVGQPVAQNQKLANSDNTGNSTGSHLHFRVRQNGVAYMPEPMSTSGSPSIPVSGFGNYGTCKGVSSVSWGSTLPFSNVLKNGKFETDPVMADYGGPWQRTSGTNWQVFTTGGQDGPRYLQMNIGSAGSGASVWQQFAVDNSDWSNDSVTRTFISTPDTWTVRVWMRTPNCPGITGTLAAWALNGPPQENGSTGFVLNTSWQQFTATLRFDNNGHNRLQVQVYMDSANSACNYAFDGVTLQRNYINNSSFEQGTSYWVQRFPGYCASYWWVYTDAGAKDNQSRLQINRGTCGSGDDQVSFFQDVAAYTKQGDKHYARVWARRPTPGHGGGWFKLQLWALWGTIDGDGVWFYISPGDTSWREVEISKIINYSGNNILRTEVYLWDSDQYDFDGFQIYGGTGEP